LEDILDIAEEILVGADLKNQSTQVFSYENKEYTFKGELKNYDYTQILKDKQKNIYKLYELASYYVDADDIISGVVKRVLTPFSLSCGYKLKGGGEKAKQRYYDYYDMVGFSDIARSIFIELYTFGNCFIYFMPDGSLITLPPHRVRISEVCINGEPVIEFNVVELNRRLNYGGQEGFLDALAIKYQGYPPEIAQSLKGGSASSWIQLNPENTFVLQESKPMWQRYSIPFISTCLKPLAKKELISYYEDVQLNIGAKGFLHVKLGNDALLPKPTGRQLDVTARLFQDALNKFPLAVTSHFVDAKFISIDTKGMFDNSKYKEVNAQIMSSGGISPLVVTGESDGGSFAQANVSVEIASQRITQNQNNFAEMMKKYNRKLAMLWRISETKIPVFVFNRLDLMNTGKMREEAFQLWQQGCVSRKTLLNDYYSMDYEQEKERKSNEFTSGDELIFYPPTSPFHSSNITSTDTKPEKPLNELKQDKNNSKTSAQPKPSNT